MIIVFAGCHKDATIIPKGVFKKCARRPRLRPFKRINPWQK
jgi:hypothetical protein|tara:strand:+ start:760 stop:882 length:123 start_codon:yes stop_codon:yes gene_type:complete